MALNGTTIVNARATHQAEEMRSLLRSRGAMPGDYPTIAMASAQDSTLLDACPGGLEGGQFDWLVRSSANTVLAIADRAQVLRLCLTGKPTYPEQKI